MAAWRVYPAHPGKVGIHGSVRPLSGLVPDYSQSHSGASLAKGQSLDIEDNTA
jgi:hypothetical protein